MHEDIIIGFSKVINNNYYTISTMSNIKIEKVLYRARNAYNLGSIAVNKVLRVYVKSGVCV